MKKGEIFTFTAPNGVEVTAVVVGSVYQGSCVTALICYAQNKIFTYIEETFSKNEDGTWARSYSYGWEIADYAILPDYDAVLESYSDHQVTLAEEQSGM